MWSIGIRLQSRQKKNSNNQIKHTTLKKKKTNRWWWVVNRTCEWIIVESNTSIHDSTWSPHGSIGSGISNTERLDQRIVIWTTWSTTLLHASDALVHTCVKMVALRNTKMTVCTITWLKLDVMKKIFCVLNRQRTHRWPIQLSTSSVRAFPTVQSES